MHEFGHFIIAKLCKIKVNEFAIGFGPTILKKQGKETKYALRLFPLGGFVNMEGEDEESDDERSFSKASIKRRLLIVFGGPIINIIIALIIFFIIASFFTDKYGTIIKEMVEDYSAASSELEVGDKILEINNKEVIFSGDVSNIISNSNGKELDLKINRNNEEKVIKITPTDVSYAEIGLYLADENSTKVLAMEKDSVSEKAGIVVGDIITKVDDEEVENDLKKLSKKVSTEFKEGKREFEFIVNRKGSTISLKIRPEERHTYLLGIIFEKENSNFIKNIYYGFTSTGDFIKQTFNSFAKLFTGKVNTSQMMGPIGISEQIVKTDGLKEFFTMLALISISIGVMNLLPFPPLDGFKILLLLIEAIRRKPFKKETEAKMQLIGFAILIMLSIYIAYIDILRL